MSSIRSASSNTRKVHRDMFVTPVSRKSNNRPGVAMQTSMPFCKLIAWLFFGAPPYKQAYVNPTTEQYSRATSATCWASSRVGSKIKADGPSRGRRRGWFEMCMMPGNKNWKTGLVAVKPIELTPRVLPEPVFAMDIMSRPLRATGQEIDWMIVGWS